MKSSILMTHENCEGPVSSTRRTWNSKNPSRTRLRSWKHQSLLLCRVKFWRVIRIVGVVHPIKPKQNSRVFWKLMNLRDCVWEIHYQIIIKTFAGKGDNSLQHYNLVHKIYSHASSHENSRSKGSSGQGMRKIRENFGVEPDESQK